METRTIILPTSCIKDFEGRVAKVNKRATKLGCEHVEILSVENTRIQKIEDTDGIHTREVCDLTFTTPDIRIQGYSLSGFISRDSHGAVSITNRTMDDFTVYAEPDFTRCDHCHTKHQRNKLIVLKNETGEEIVVGKSCLKDFMGIAPSTYYSFVTVFDELGNDEYARVGFSAAFQVEPAVALAFEIASKYGYVKTSEADDGKSPTCNDVFAALNKGYEATEEYQEKAKEAIAYFRNLSQQETQKSEYIYNLTQVLANDTADVRKMGLVCSTYIAYKNAMNHNEKKAESNHVGTVGEKLTTTVTVTDIATIPGDFGYSTRYNMKDEQGNALVCFTTSAKFNPKEGETITIEAKVKKHEEYRGFKKTMLTRIKYAK